jgi:hypothetical protein
LQTTVSEGDADPWKSFEVLVEARFILVAGTMDDFEPLVREVDVVVELNQDRGENAARRAPVGGK